MDKTLKASIDRLVKLSLYLFILTNIAIFGTLLSHNVFTHSKFTYNYFPFDSQNLDDYECNVDNNFCRDFLKIKSDVMLYTCCSCTKNYTTIHDFFHV